MKELFLWFCLAALLRSSSIDADDAATSSTGAILVINYAIDGPTHVEAQPARFGIPDYNGDRKGKVESMELLDIDAGVVEASAGLGCQPYSSEIINDWTHRFEKPIALVRRGECKFVDKVKNAQNAGATAVIVVDYGETTNVMSPPEDFDHSDVVIPAVMIKNSDGTTMTEKMHTETITASIEWDVPRKDGKVELELYTSSQDAEDMAFKRNFRNLARLLNQDDKFVFTPVYMIEDGEYWSCTDSLETCGDQCANQGKYCAVDPDEEIFFGISGYDVVEENVRQLCLWNWTQAIKDQNTGIEEEDVWWEYVAQFDDNCLVEVSETGDHNIHERCSRDQLTNVQNALQLPESVDLWNSINTCMTDYGEVSKIAEGHNALLDQVVSERKHKHITLLPSFAVNGFETLGSWHCPQDPSADTCNVFKALCAGFLDDQKPTLCFNDAGCPAGKFKDACGECTCVPDNAAGTPVFSGMCRRDSTDDCDTYMNAGEEVASQASVVAIGVVIALVTMCLAASLFYLWRKNDEHSKVIQETKQYLSLDDDFLGAAPVQVVHSGMQKNTGHSMISQSDEPELADTKI